jgi:hypothetical protein
MKHKILLDWDSDTGMIYDASDMYIGCSITLNPFEVEKKGTVIDDLVKLHNAGFTTEDIIELKRKELI